MAPQILPNDEISGVTPTMLRKVRFHRVQRPVRRHVIERCKPHPARRQPTQPRRLDLAPHPPPDPQTQPK